MGPRRYGHYPLLQIRKVSHRGLIPPYLTHVRVLLMGTVLLYEHKLAELDPNTQRAWSFGDGEWPSVPLTSVTVGVAQHCPDDAVYYNWKQFAMHCFQEQIQKAAQGLLRNPCLLVHWAKGRRHALLSHVHSRALSKPHATACSPFGLGRRR